MGAMYYVQSVIGIGVAITVAICGFIGFSRRSNVGWLILALNSLLGIATRIAHMVLLVATRSGSFSSRSNYFEALGVIGMLEEALFVIAIVFILGDVAAEQSRRIAAPHIPPGGVKYPPRP